MPKPNRHCKWCGKEYYACNSCLKSYEFYKTSFCSKECYEEFSKDMKKILDING